MPLTDAQQAALDAGREKGIQFQQQQAQAPQQPDAPVRYRYLARQQLKVGNGYRQPGEEIPEAADWPPQVRKAYLNTGQIEEIQTTDGTGVERKPQGALTFAPEGYDELEQARLRRLQEAQAYEQRTRKLPDTAERHPGDGLIELDCRNCRTLNYLSKELAESQSGFHCWRCRDRQSVAEAMSYPPQSWDEWQRTGFRQGGR
jgi:hypothetical protein